MRLDNDCIRDIMLYIEDNTHTIKDQVNVRSMIKELNYDRETVYYHLEKMAQANFIKSLNGKNDHYVSSLTWEGHQYLDNIREDHIWKAVKEKANTVGSVSLQVMIPLATAMIKQKLGFS